MKRRRYKFEVPIFIKSGVINKNITKKTNGDRIQGKKGNDKNDRQIEPKET